jgi:predicted metal-dependent HD superfamily phosphohydrolase
MAEPAPPSVDGWALPAPMWHELRTAYSAPGRFYHDARHLDEVLARFAEVARDVGWQSPSDVLLALLFHDVVYVPTRHDNEAESAVVARSAIARWLADRPVAVERIVALILLTARHGTLTTADVDSDAALFADCDMSILGTTPERFDQYERDVAHEYAAVPPELYAAGRRHFLERLLTVERIFLSDYFHARLDGAARANLRRTLGRR